MNGKPLGLERRKNREREEERERKKNRQKLKRGEKRGVLLNPSIILFLKHKSSFTVLSSFTSPPFVNINVYIGFGQLTGVIFFVRISMDLKRSKI